EYSIVHIAGTKGKGTTAGLIAAGLTACGQKTGLYTSPHLVHLEERIQLNGQVCSREDITTLTEAVRLASQRLTSASDPSLGSVSQPTFFELTTAMGLLYFARQGADYVVLEVGLGGRLDSTNVCQPALTLITSIGLDHQAQLGETITEIAGEKAGIIKPGVPLICTALHPDARSVIKDRAAEQGAPAYFVEEEFSFNWQIVTETGDSDDMHCCRAMGDFAGRTAEFNSLNATKWHTPLLGSHQSGNLAGAIAAFALLGDGAKLETARLQQAIAACAPSGRVQIVGKSPTQIIDTAHNSDSIRAGLHALAEHFPGRPITVVLAASKDKDYTEMLRLILPVCQHLVVTQFTTNPRALPLEQLGRVAAEQRRELGLDGQVEIEFAITPADAWSLGNRVCTPEGVLYATGSFFLAAELLA
ncbi:MAG TPA: hypothetical protein DDW52_30025, partial [Planctomycetaceae bacterium]|nr:hypothetical protein [Planctomycetaceae bacterium]